MAMACVHMKNLGASDIVAMPFIIFDVKEREKRETHQCLKEVTWNFSLINYFYYSL